MSRRRGRRVGAWTLILLAAQALATGAAAQTPAAQVARARASAFVDSLLAEMTLEEKLGQLVQHRGEWSEAHARPQVQSSHLPLIRDGAIGSFLSVYGAEYLGTVQRIAVEETRLGIPLLFAHDIIHGFRTIFPVPLAEASTWDPESVERSARIAAIEAAASGIHWTFAPMVDVARDPRWGRIVEGSGEDPYLGAVLAAARVRGFQVTNLADTATVLATAKHFAAYGGAEGGRDYNVVDVSEATLREIYLPPFRAAVAAGVGSVMAAFNEIGGVPMHAHERLIDGVLRAEWGFEGVVVSDYTGVAELQAHGVAGSAAAAGALALAAGVDIDMVSDIYRTALAEGVRSGAVLEADVDAAARRVLAAKEALGLFDDPYRYHDPEREQAVILAPEHRRAAREVAGRSIVLLKNEGGALPLARDLATLAVVGPLADDAQSALGPWAGAGRAEDAITVLQGIRVTVPGTEVRYAPVAGVLEGERGGIAEAVRIAESADAVILVLGETREMSGEAVSRSTLDLPGAQRELAEAVLATGVPVVVVLMNGRPLSVGWLDERAPAILEAWFLGIEMGHAVADVLFGDVNPSGKLPVTFPRTVGQVPIYYNHKNTGRPPAEEKYTSKYVDLPWSPLYPFGHGLSYTTFRYGAPRIAVATMSVGDTLEVQVDVTNAGDRAGDEVVQLYLRDEVASVTRPVKELRGFRRIRLEPGETRTVTFEITREDLVFWGPDGEWIAEPGAFRVMVGGSSEEVQEGRFELVGDDGSTPGGQP